MQLSRRIFLIGLVCFFVSCSGKKSSEQSETPVKDTNAIKQVSPERSPNPYATVDLSPMDMSYFPVDYPKRKMANATEEPPLARVIYSRPHLGGRRLFHDLQKYGEPWRLGANESTELQLYKPATILGKKVPAGRYILYCIPYPDKWTIAINSNIDSWGLTQDTTKDVTRFDIPVKNISNHVEYFTMVFEKTDTGADLLMAWDGAEARIPFSF